MKRLSSLSAALAPTALAVLLCGGLLAPSTALAASAAPSIAPPAVPAAASPTPVALADQHLADEMDKYNQTFDVYTDLDAGGNHFVSRAMTGQDVAFDDSSAVVYRGRTSLRGSFTPSNSSSWGGWYLMNGVLLGNATAPSANWGTYPNAGYDLTGATQLTFWVRGAVGGERVEFFALGIGRNPTTGAATEDYPDSEAKVTLCGRLVSPCWTTLSANWSEYTIDLSGLDLSYVLGGFGWVANAEEDPNPITFYADDIAYNKPHLNDLHFITSYVTMPSGISFDSAVENTAYSYDNALALLAFLSDGDWRRASQIADAFVYAQRHDRYYSDGRIRNAYQSGDLEAPPGWTPNGHTGTARLPGSSASGTWNEDPGSVGSGTGNIAWVMIALLRYYESRGGNQYLQAAIDLGTWVESQTRDTHCVGGYTGGYDGPERTPTKLPWKSTEHNIDLWAAFGLLHRATGDPVWQTRADYARAFVESMWDDAAGYYRTGTLDDGCTANGQAIPLDAQAWSLLAFGSNSQTLRAIAYVESHHQVCRGSFCGFDFNEDRDMPWPEGTAQMVDVYWALSRAGDASYYLDDLTAIQAAAHNSNGKGIVAAPADGLTTGFGWAYYDRLHIGATAWFVLAERMYDPLTLERLVVTPTSTAIAAGASQAYRAERFDANGVSLGDVTSATTFSISGGGTCTRALCTSTVLGDHTVIGTDGTATGTAALYVTGATYHPITPVRLLDTRAANGLSGKLRAGVPATFQVTGRGGIPSGATAVTGNVTVVNESNSWAVYLGPNPVASPTTSTINFASGEVAGNGLTVALSATGSLSATYMSTAGNTTDLVFDVTGFFTPDASGATYHPMAPSRLLDTRSGNGLSGKLSANTPATFQVTGRGGIPANATAVTGNVTVVNSTFSWAVYLGPVATAKPTTSTINFSTGQVKGNSLTADLGAGGILSATYMSTASNTTDLVFDVTGYYTADATGASYAPVTPARLLDTRFGNGLSGRLSANTPRTFQVTGRGGVPGGATAVTGNVTVVNETNSWAVFLGPDPTPAPTTSTVNFNTGDVKGNGLTVALGAGGSLSATYISTGGNTTDLVFDVTGYFVP